MKMYIIYFQNIECFKDRIGMCIKTTLSNNSNCFFLSFKIRFESWPHANMQ